MEAFRVPILKKQVEKVKNEAEESRLMNRRLAEVLDERTKQVAVLESNIAQLLDDRTKQVAVLEEERDRFRDRINELVEEHANQITNCKMLTEVGSYITNTVFIVKCQQAELERRLIVEQRTLKEYLEKEASFKEQLDATLEENDLLKDENSKLLSFCNDPDKSVQVSIICSVKNPTIFCSKPYFDKFFHSNRQYCKNKEIRFSIHFVYVVFCRRCSRCVLC